MQQENITHRKSNKQSSLASAVITESDTIRSVSVADELRGYLRELVSANERNQKELAKSAGASQSYLSMILSGKRLGNELLLLERLAKALDVPLSRIVSEAERRDLLRHGRTGQLNSHQGGGADVPAEARIRELEDRLKAYQTIHRQLRKRITEAVALIGDSDEGAKPARKGTGRRGRH